MGLNRIHIEFLSELRRELPAVASMLTLGRQHICIERPHQIDDGRLRRELGLWELRSIDVSPSEGADYVHDLNERLPDKLQHAFSIVYDGGTLEHCFDPVRATDNAASAVAIGGWFVVQKMVNMTGHGFWEFSPEWLAAWAESRGFDSCRCELFRLGPWARRRPVKLHTGRRIELTSIFPLHMQFACRRKVEPGDLKPRIQAGPSLTRPLKFWTWEARAWAK